MTAPGALFSNVSDSGGLSVLGTVQMTKNPNGQMITLSGFDLATRSFYAQPHAT